MPYFTDNSGVSFDAANHKIILGTSLDKLIQLKDVNPLVVAAYQAQGLQFETAKQAGLPSRLVKTNYLDFSPRAGVAYRITTGNKPLVVRGGFAQYTYPEPGRLYTAQFSLTQPYLGVFQNNPNSASLSPDGLSNYFLRAAPTIVAGLNSADALNLSTVTIAPGAGQMFYLIRKRSDGQHRGEGRLHRTTRLQCANYRRLQRTNSQLYLVRHHPPAASHRTERRRLDSYL
jgi:hypothetical protein